MHIKWLRISLEDLDEILNYIARENPAMAGKTAALIGKKVQLLTEYPDMGRPGRVDETRELVIDGTPFIVPYRIIGNEVHILRVLHASRNWPEAL